MEAPVDLNHTTKPGAVILIVFTTMRQPTSMNLSRRIWLQSLGVVSSVPGICSGTGSLSTPLVAQSPSTYANTSGATIEASELIMNLGQALSSLHQVIFSFGTAPE